MSSEQTPLLLPDFAAFPPQQRLISSSSRPLNSNLIMFRHAIGINDPASSPSPFSFLESGRHPKPTGLYAQVVSKIRSRRFLFHVVDIFYYFIIITQLLLGAVIASLSALSSLPDQPPHTSSISILGIINSLTAGALALLKGQGLPDRLRKDEFQMQRVKDWIEEVEARLGVTSVDGGEGEDQGWVERAGGVEGLVRQAWEMYGTARDTSEMNRPSSYAHQADGPTAGLTGVMDVGGLIGKGKGLVTNLTGDVSSAVQSKAKWVID